MASGNAPQSALSPRETEILIAAFVSLEENKLDMTKFTKYSGFKNQNSARANFAPLKKRILEMAGEDGLTIPSQAARSKGKRKSNADGNAAEVAGSDGANPDDAPANKPSSAPAKKARVAKKTQVVKSEEGAQDGQAKASGKADTTAKKRGASAKAEAVNKEAASENDAEKEEKSTESS
ncbi:hypothetical protein BJ166DRAFT_595134 [Pestalotiopsis sp. NC0098]|nr:hypothetical protein BJ166DRAFT_595134 [Pestalotiopsis sp. NC0098]